MSISRLSKILMILGFVSLIGGISLWALRMPKDPGLLVNYSRCLLTATYSVDLKNIVLMQQLRNPDWNASETSCANAEAEYSMDYVKKAQRDIKRIETGRDPGYSKYEEPILFNTPPFLNILGALLLSIGLIIFFSRSDSPPTNFPRTN